MSNQVSGPNSSDPQKNQPINTQAEKDRAKRVEKVEKIDPDEQARNRRKERFRTMMEESDDVATPANSKPPSPIDLFAAQSSKKSLGNLEDSALPSPASSPSPNLQPNLEGHDQSSDDLPHSNEFWNQVDLPNEPLKSVPNMELNKKENILKPPSKNLANDEPLAAPAALKSAAPKVDADKFAPLDQKKKGPPNKNPPFYSANDTNSDQIIGPKKPKLDQKLSKPIATFEPKAEKNETEEDTGKKAPTGRYWEKELSIENRAKPFATEKEENQDSLKASKKPHQKQKSEANKEEIESDSQMPSFSKTPPQTFEETFQKNSRSRKDNEAISSIKDAPFIAQGTPDIQTAAVQAALQAQPYLSPEALPLFFQFVGSIMVMLFRSGISKTEVKLDGSLFEKSKFYGSTIEITKYSTAPHSINIKLTGTNEAVTAFNQNLGQLRNAFEKGNFNFRIGRLVAEYSTDRPVVRRKSGDGEKGR